MEQMLEYALRKRLRWPTTRGAITLEDLWDLPLSSKTNVDLDTVAKTVNKELKESSEESFVTPTSSKNAELQVRLDIVKHVIKTKIDDNAKALDSAKKKARKELLLQARESKQQQDLMNMSIDDIDKELNTL
jgi:hypothetical protein